MTFVEFLEAIALLFDGFDELVQRITYDRATEHFNTLLQGAQGRAKIVVTSRTTHFENEQQVRTPLFNRLAPQPGLRVVRLAAFDESQVAEFLQRQYGLKATALVASAAVMRPPRKLANSDPKMAAPKELPMVRKKVTPEVATPRSEKLEVFCTTSTSTCMHSPIPEPSRNRNRDCTTSGVCASMVDSSRNPTNMTAVPATGKIL